MKLILGVVVFCILQMGCSSSYEVSSSPNAATSFSTFNVDAYGRIGTIVFQGGSEVDARNIFVVQDSTRYEDETTKATAIVSTSTIKKVIFTNRGTGFLEGFGWGVAIGVVTGTALGLIATNAESSPHSFGGADDLSVILALAAVGGGAGGVIGGIWGVSAGHSYEYQFPTSAGSAKY